MDRQSTVDSEHERIKHIFIHMPPLLRHRTGSYDTSEAFDDTSVATETGTAT